MGFQAGAAVKPAGERYYDAMHNPPFPNESGPLQLAGPVGALDVVVDLPKADVTPQPVVAVICHPLSTEGGSLHNKVVTMVGTTLRELGITTVRFNLVSIAPPAGRWDFDGVQPPANWLVIQGEDDEIVDPQAVYTWLDSLDAPHELVRMPETSHFFHRKLIDLRGALTHGVKHWLPHPDSASA